MLFKIEISHMTISKGVRFRLSHSNKTDGKKIRHRNGVRLFKDKKQYLISHEDNVTITKGLNDLFETEELVGSPSFKDMSYSEFNTSIDNLKKTVNDVGVCAYLDRIVSETISQGEDYGRI
jgi:hypothetical protein